MDYTDIYLRQRGKEESTARVALRPAEIETGTEERVERMLKSAFSVQQLVDNIDALSNRVDKFDEKMVNLTKLVKLAQGLQEKKENDFRRQQHELRSRLKRQEQLTGRLQEELDALKEKIPSTIQDAVSSACQHSLDNAVKDQKRSEEQFLQMKRDLENTLQNTQSELEQRSLILQKEMSSTVASQLEVQGEFRERLFILEKAVQEFEASTARERLRLAPFEANIERVSELLGPLQRKVDETATTVGALGEQRNKVQDVLVEEMESTRQWVTRNLQRVRQHVEALSNDVVQLHSEQASLSRRLKRVSCQADVEHKKLRALLLQKVQEANALGTIVEREFSKVEGVADRHQALRTEMLDLRDIAFDAK